MVAEGLECSLRPVKARIHDGDLAGKPASEAAFEPEEVAVRRS
jgi:hypothetical protein